MIIMSNKLIKRPIPDYMPDKMPSEEEEPVSVKHRLQSLVLNKKKVNAELAGYEQMFPHVLDYLNTLNDENKLDRNVLLKMSKAKEEVETTMNTTTRDDYTWYRGYYFKAGEGELAILLPWAQDFKKEEGTQMDRSIGIYKTGNADSEEVSRILKTIEDRLFVSVPKNP